MSFILYIVSAAALTFLMAIGLGLWFNRNQHRYRLDPPKNNKENKR